jgi:hypothetical protein
MNQVKILFSVNEYDKDGDLINFGIFLHFGETKIKVASDMGGFKNVIAKLQSMCGEIEETMKEQRK